MKIATVAFVAGALALLAGCETKGTCEMKYEEASKDGSIPAGLEMCAANWVPEKCNASAMSSISLGLKTSGYTFTKGATCEERGYKDCSEGMGVGYYKTCPPN